MDIPNYFPFTKLRLPIGEDVMWHATNPTFHRSSEYGIIVTCEALYLYYAPFFLWTWFTRWRRIPILDIKSICFNDSGRRPALQIEFTTSSTSFSTPYDMYKDEMDFDRKKLAEIVKVVNKLLKQA